MWLAKRMATKRNVISINCRNFDTSNYRRACCPEGATFSERRLGKSLVPIYSNPIMFAHDLCHSRIEYFSLRLDSVPQGNTGLRPGFRLVELAEPKARREGRSYGSESDTTNLQFPDKSGSPLRADRLVRVGVLLLWAIGAAKMCCKNIQTDTC
jgi:hypothetical protein